MTAYIEHVVTEAINTSDAVSLGNAILGIVLVFLPISWFYALFWAFAEALIAIGNIALEAAFDEGVYEVLQCLFYCELDDEGRITQGGLENVQAGAVDAFGGNPVIDAVLALAFEAMGAVGMSNAGAKDADPDADCSECDCQWCYYFPNPTAANYPDIMATWNFVNDGGLPDTWIQGTRIDFDDANRPVFLEVEFEVEFSGLAGTQFATGWRTSSFSPPSTDGDFVNVYPVPSTPYTVHWDGVLDTGGRNYMWIEAGAGTNYGNAAGNTARINWVRIRGRGDFMNKALFAPYEC